MMQAPQMALSLPSSFEQFEQDPKSEGNFDQKLERLIKLIDSLSGIDEINKWWARKDAETKLKAGVNEKELREKYFFYHEIGQLRQQIIANVPAPHQERIFQLINTILDEPSRGNRNLKRERVERIRRSVEAFRTKQISLQFLVEKNALGADSQVLRILNEEAFDRVATIFPDEFWSAADRMVPSDFPNVGSTLNLALKATFTQEHSLTELKKLPLKIKAACIRDAEELVQSFFSPEEKDAAVKKIKGLSEEKPAQILKALLELHAQKEKNQKAAKQSLARVKSFIDAKNPRWTWTEADQMQRNFGSTVFSALGEKKFLLTVEEKCRRAEQLEKEISKEKDPKKQNALLRKLHEIQSAEFSPAVTKTSETKEQSEMEEILQEMNELRQQGDLEGAENEAQKLFAFDSVRAKKEIEKMRKERAEQEGEEEETDEPEIETSEDKETKIKFLEKCIEHARRVMEACHELGIPTNDPHYWGLEGVRNRVEWLRQKGLWDTYVRFNQSDPNMPSRTYAQGFRFRWVDLKTDSHLTPAIADKGIEYFQRFKESGYRLAALAGAFSMNWRGNSSPVYSPDRFISLAEEEIGKVWGKSAQEHKLAA